MDNNNQLSNADAFEVIKSALVEVTEPRFEGEPTRGVFYAAGSFYGNHQFVRFDLGVSMPFELAVKLREALLRRD